MLRAFDPALPLERPLIDSLTIYRKRLMMLLAVVLANAVVLAALWLGARGLVIVWFPILAILLVLVAVSALKLRGRHARENSEHRSTGTG